MTQHCHVSGFGVLMNQDPQNIDKRHLFRLRRNIIELLYTHFREFPYAPLEMQMVADHCQVAPKSLNWNIVYLEKCGFVELGKSIEAPPFVACTASISEKGIDLIEDAERFDRKFPPDADR